MNIPALLTLQTVPFAAIVLSGREDRDLFAVVYLAVFGLILTLVVLTGDRVADAPSFAAEIQSLSAN
ncbi:hypothetical protein [Methylobacterium sp. 37f]|uniref:hypothetical protein n=1 Tax=Methylobacterium sp. 37f TaxID=2817058 RepID=UPI001FFCD70D|nr:hypothetical protein [Methylobacterium sp. 37f]MCK2054358.1 hypothetical protein [Methylobacterium sp. 37f]